ncbi:MAG TPA: aminotransferase class IV, partial [Syntrophobacteraceae bacterium]|nr:aminotransferase class IV [Syntrophobacteraceae bacterium]
RRVVARIAPQVRLGAHGSGVPRHGISLAIQAPQRERHRRWQPRRIAETAAGSLLLRSGGKWWTPRSDYQLPGITLRHVMKIMEETGRQVTRRFADAADLFSAETIWVLNSLIGIAPVSQLDHRQLKEPLQEEACRLRAEFFARGRQRGPL